MLAEYLKSQKRWVAARELCERFNMDQRSLRGIDSPLRTCAISSDEGYKHVDVATDEEFKHWCMRIRSHARAELERVEQLEMRRYEARMKKVQAEFSFTDALKEAGGVLVMAMILGSWLFI